MENRLNNLKGTADLTKLKDLETYTSSPLDFLKINLLLKRDDVIEALRKYEQFTLMKAKPPANILISRIRSVWYSVRSSIKRNYKPDVYNDLEKKAKSKEVTDALSLFFEIEEYLDKMKVTRIDIYEIYDDTVTEKANQRRGY